MTIKKQPLSTIVNHYKTIIKLLLTIVNPSLYNHYKPSLLPGSAPGSEAIPESTSTERPPRSSHTRQRCQGLLQADAD